MINISAVANRLLRTFGKNDALDAKDKIILDFICRTEHMAYRNKSEVCCFCSGGQTYYRDRKGRKKGGWKGDHASRCIYFRAKKEVGFIE